MKSESGKPMWAWFKGAGAKKVKLHVQPHLIKPNVATK